MDRWDNKTFAEIAQNKVFQVYIAASSVYSNWTINGKKIQTKEEYKYNIHYFVKNWKKATYLVGGNYMLALVQVT